MASGDRLDEYPDMYIAYEKRGVLFCHAFEYIRNVQESYSKLDNNDFGIFSGHIEIWSTYSSIYMTWVSIRLTFETVYLIA